MCTYLNSLPFEDKEEEELLVSWYSLKLSVLKTLISLVWAKHLKMCFFIYVVPLSFIFLCGCINAWRIFGSKYDSYQHYVDVAQASSICISYGSRQQHSFIPDNLRQLLEYLMWKDCFTHGYSCMNKSYLNERVDPISYTTSIL